MRKTLILAAALMATAISSVASAAQDEARLLRFPAVGGNTIVFSYAGNLYSVGIDGGQARKLTSHVGYEVFPRISPDGRTIAFTAQYDGNTEVYTMPVEGGEPFRVTYTALSDRDNVGERMGPNNIVMCWSPDGKSIVFRNKQWCFSGLRAQLQSVSAKGGTPVDIPTTEGGFCCYSPDGKYLAMNRMFREFRTWKYYRGGQADDIWIHKVGTTRIERIEGCSPEGQDIFPMWIGDEIFYLSDRDRTMNLFVYNTATKKTEKVTDFTEYDCKFPSFSKDYVVFENGGYIYRFKVSDRSLTKVPIYLQDDNIYSRKETICPAGEISAWSLAPDAKNVLVCAHGDIFSIPAGKGAVVNLTASAGANDRDVDYSPDGKKVAYISDKNGEYQAFVAPADDFSKAVAVTSFKKGYPQGMRWSPDNRTVYVSVDNFSIYAVDVETRKQKVLLSSSEGGLVLGDVSADSTMIAYQKPLSNSKYGVFIRTLKDGRDYQVSDSWYSASNPIFSSDSKTLFFTSQRDYQANYSSVEWNASYRLSSYIFKVDLSDKNALVENTKALKTDAGYFRLISATPDKLYYTAGGRGGKGGLKVYDLKKEKESDGAKEAPLTISADGKNSLVRKDGKYYIVPFNGGKFEDALPVEQMTMTVDHAAEWRQIFEESWRITRDGFYVENMHGVDWKAIHDKYAALLPYVKHRHDLTYILGEMVGELNVGHAYVTSGSSPAVPRVRTGLLGGRFSRSDNGAFKVEKVFRGADWDKSLRCPLAENGIKAGEYITEINGVPASAYSDIQEALVDKVDRTVTLTVASSAAGKDGRNVDVKPVGSEVQLAYYDWVMNNVDKVSAASGGQIGYIHIPDMSVEGLDMFTKMFYSQLDKKALIIDDRMNGGGNVSPMILERLQRVVYRMTMRRDSDRNDPVPNEAFYGPKVCLIDKYSSSDGDLFPYGFRKLGLGKLIGKRSWGGIVGISGSKRFLDGQDMRTPFFTSYGLDGNWIIEGHGVDPDIDVDINPFEDYVGKDAQLDKAIEVLKEEMKNYPELPSTPKAPVKNR